MNSAQVTSYHQNFQNIFSLVYFAFFVSFMEEQPPIKFYSAFGNFLRTYEVAKFWMIKLCLDTSDVIHANEHTKYAICVLHVNFWNFCQCHFVLWRNRIILSKNCCFSLRSNLTWFLSSSLHSISCVYFFCTVHTTIMNLAYFNPHSPQLAE